LYSYSQLSLLQKVEKLNSLMATGRKGHPRSGYLIKLQGSGQGMRGVFIILNRFLSIFLHQRPQFHSQDRTCLPY
jgi:hypothetical protein